MSPVPSPSTKLKPPCHDRGSLTEFTLPPFSAPTGRELQSAGRGAGDRRQNLPYPVLYGINLWLLQFLRYSPSESPHGKRGSCGPATLLRSHRT
jgi:hypothetical protein